MKLLSIILFAFTLAVPGFSQNGQLAKSVTEYIKMYNNRKIKMARSHAEFYAEAEKSKILWKYFKEKKFATAFLKSMKFCKDGLITIDLGVKDEAFQAAVGKVLGFEPTFWGSWKKGYCCEDDGCSPCSVHSKCNSKNCGKAVMTGDAFSPEEVLAS